MADVGRFRMGTADTMFIRGHMSFVHHHGFWMLLRVVMSSPFILYLHPIPDLISVQHY